MNFYNELIKLKNFCLDLIFPIECLGCGKENTWLCEKCLENIPLNQNQICPLCKKISLYGRTCPNCRPYSFLDGILIAGHYQNKLLQKSIYALKYQFVVEIAKPLGSLLIKLLKSFQNNFVFQEEVFMKLDIFTRKDTLFIPIPLHKRKFRERGFNQTELLAQEVSQSLGWLVEKEVLKRKRYTGDQTKLPEKKREENMKNAFVCLNPEKIANKRIILLDDVMTTGATLQEAAKTLKNAGAKEVWGLALAHG